MEKQAEHQLLFFFNDTATTEIYTLSLHDALPISHLWRYLRGQRCSSIRLRQAELELIKTHAVIENVQRSEEHTSELQSHSDLVCRLLLEKKKNACIPTEAPGSTQVL